MGWNTKGFSMAAAAVLTAAASFSVVPAQAATSVYVQIAPPAPRYEVMPAPRRGHVWVPGHWEWNGRRHVWMAGHWVVARPGFEYANARWDRRGDRWVYVPGEWVRPGLHRGVDRNHNGIPDRAERDRNHNGIPDRAERRDNDRDGVPNAYDRRPNNPNRY